MICNDMMLIDFLLTWWPFILLLAGVGAFSGFLAGLLGIGGGIVLVPALYYGFNMLGYDVSVTMHVAVGTSLAIIVPTGLSSARAHVRRDSVDQALVRRMAPGVLCGVLCGTFVAGLISGTDLKVFFAIALLFLAGLMLYNRPRAVTADAGQSANLRFPRLVGGVIGMVSSLVGVGGATMSVPYMTLGGIPVRSAVGTAAALGLVISVPAALGFMVIGWTAAGLPPFSVGYVNGAAWAIIVPFSVLAAPLGAHVAHNIPVGALKKVFAAAVMIIALYMLWDAIGG